MPRVIVYIATSQDGFIADENGSVDWLPQTTEECGGEDYGYPAFYESIDAIAIGRKTYEQILGFGDWPYPGKTSYIFSRSPTKSNHPDIAFVTQNIPDFMKSLEEKKVKRLWMVGGSDLIESFYHEGFIDEFIITKFPKILKKGIPLKTLDDALKAGELNKEKSMNFGGDTFQDYFSIKHKGKI